MTTSDTFTTIDGVEITAPVMGDYASILTPEAQAFIAKLARTFEGRRQELLQRRIERQQQFDQGKLPDFLPETAEIRAGDWQIAPFPAEIADRRVEITGPVDRKMIINALNSGAKVYMADFEDANSPTWQNNIEGQINLRDAVRREIDFTSPEGKRYALGEKLAVLFVRPRGWHLNEKHLLVDGKEISGSLFDFGLFFFHNVREQLARGTAPYFYLPKLESHLEARLWNDVFTLAESELGVPHGTIKATVLIETLPAAFEMDEILYELRDHSAGLNCGRWDYIFSAIKKRRDDPGFILPDRALVTMTVPFMRAYTQLCIRTCHHRGAHAMGGMAAFIPVKNNEALNEQAFAGVRADKEREATDGHDGTWVAHPGMVQLATEVFDRIMPQPNQIDRKREDVQVSAADLLATPDGPITEEGLRVNIRVGIQYIGAWLGGQGAVPLYNLMEDAATAEISRAQVWQWIRHPRGILNDGRKVTVELFHQFQDEELAKLRETFGDDGYSERRLPEAAQLFDSITASDIFVDFLTLPAYAQLP
ncbi:MAG TPA: malate synthase A [Ktedonobacterales bacterium]|jgi:malate synthase|nr:malate synthase A [Ktedonobacterales bacterium]